MRPAIQADTEFGLYVVTGLPAETYIKNMALQNSIKAALDGTHIFTMDNGKTFREKYLYFTVGLLKNSSTIDALWQDALKYHMIDQPGKLIALRLTEYYELVARGGLHPGATALMSATPRATTNGFARGDNETMTTASSPGPNGASPLNDYASDDESIVAASPDAEQNADEAAEYWAQL